MSTQPKRAAAIFFAVLVLVALNYRSAKAYTQWYVSPAGNDTWDCKSLATACKTIQAAINKAQDGDSVSVAAGTYSIATNGESFPIAIYKPLVIAGAGSTQTIVDASGSGWNVFIAGGSIGVYISGFTMQGGTQGIRLIGGGPGSSSIWGEFSRNNVTGNSGNGIETYYSTVTLEQNIIALNGIGGTTSAGINNSWSDPTIVNNIVAWNNEHGIYNTNSSPTITNNTISFNYGGTGIANTSTSSPPTTNNIVSSNDHYGIFADGTSSPINTYNDVWGNGWGEYYGTSGGTGSISNDPKFISLFDAHLQCSSPAINAGSNSAPAVPSYDFDGNPRPVGGIVDMGAIEKQPPLICLSYYYLPFIRK